MHLYGTIRFWGCVLVFLHFALLFSFLLIIVWCLCPNICIICFLPTVHTWLSCPRSSLSTPPRANVAGCWVLSSSGWCLFISFRSPFWYALFYCLTCLIIQEFGQDKSYISETLFTFVFLSFIVVRLRYSCRSTFAPVCLFLFNFPNLLLPLQFSGLISCS